MTSIFLSDVHLRDAGSMKSKLVIRFLQEVASRFEKIYILGDLFDVWPGTNAYLVRSFRPVVQTLKRLVEDGHEVHYLEGNHDFRLGEYFSDNLGIRVHAKEIVEDWGGKRVYMAHGDLGNRRDVGYRILRYLLRRDVLHLALRSVPPEWIYRVGMRSSNLSRQVQRKVTRSESAIRQIYRQAASQLFDSGYDVVIMGPTHLPDHFVQTVEGRPCQYFNTGDWVSHFTYLEFDGSQFYTRTHPVKTL
jgi:UDP-2,3-diacylglucosamine hydrolase